MENIDKNIMELANYTIEQIKKNGVQEGQVFITTGAETSFVLKDGEYNMCSTIFKEDINIRIYKDKKKGEYYINKADKENAKKAVDMAIAATSAASEDDANEVAPNQGFIEAKKGVYTPDMDKLFERMEEFRKDVEKGYPLIAVSEISAVHNNRHMVYKNTNGTVCDEYIGSYNIGISMAGHNEEKTTSMNWTGVELKDLDRRVIECGNIKETLADMEKQLEAKPMEGKFVGTLVLNPGVLREFIIYLTSLSAGSQSVLNGTAMWIDKMDKQVTDKRLSIRIAPNDERVVLGETISFDGFKSEDYDLIKNGILKNFTINYYVSKKTGKKMAPNGSSNIIVEAGDISYEDIIKNIDKGIIIDRFSGGNPAANGDFSGVAKNSFLIENGKITGAIAEVMISGNLLEMFMNIENISKETVNDGFGVSPYIAFKGITISGKE